MPAAYCLLWRLRSSMSPAVTCLPSLQAYCACMERVDKQLADGVPPEEVTAPSLQHCNHHCTITTTITAHAITITATLPWHQVEEWGSNDADAAIKEAVGEDFDNARQVHDTITALSLHHHCTITAPSLAR